jgi:hypothetical protein
VGNGARRDASLADQTQQRRARRRQGYAGLTHLPAEAPAKPPTWTESRVTTSLFTHTQQDFLIV